jgi:hypothetical protein
MRIWPYTPKTSRDNWKTLKHNNLYKNQDREWNARREQKNLTKKESIQEWLNDYYDWDISAEELREYFRQYYWYYDEILDILDYQEWIDIENYWKLDFLNFDEIDNIEDKKALKLLQNSRIISIENNWKEISETTTIYIRDKKANIRAEIILKDLFWYLQLDDKDLRKSLNLFIDSNHIIDLDINIKNRSLKDEYLPKHLKWHNSMPTYNWKKKAA